jgi:branched-chain amino acid transport system permease protein
MVLAINSILAGLAIGSVYGLIAISYVVIFKATHVFNIAQGPLVAVGLLVGYFTLTRAGWPQPLGFLAIATVIVALSLLEERFAVRPFLRIGASSIGWFISTLAFSLVLGSAATIIYGNQPPAPIPSPLPSSALRIGQISVTPQMVFAFGAIIIMTVILEWFYRATWLGTGLRGSAEDREIAALRGIDPRRVSLVAFLIAGIVTAVAAYALGPILNADVTVGLTYGLKAFVALAIGGFGSIRGALVGAWVLGVTEQLFDLYGSPNYEILAGLGLLLIVLTIRPSGLFGARAVREV